MATGRRIPFVSKTKITPAVFLYRQKLIKRVASGNGLLYN